MLVSGMFVATSGDVKKKPQESPFKFVEEEYQSNLYKLWNLILNYDVVCQIY